MIPFNLLSSKSKKLVQSKSVEINSSLEQALDFYLINFFYLKSISAACALLGLSPSQSKELMDSSKLNPSFLKTALSEAHALSITKKEFFQEPYEKICSYLDAFITRNEEILRSAMKDFFSQCAEESKISLESYISEAIVEYHKNTFGKNKAAGSLN